jgi:hypothetical protein
MLHLGSSWKMSQLTRDRDDADAHSRDAVNDRPGLS